jgi:hypothetical protein
VKTKNCGEVGLATMGDHNFRPRPSPSYPGRPSEAGVPLDGKTYEKFCSVFGRCVLQHIFAAISKIKTPARVSISPFKMPTLFFSCDT